MITIRGCADECREAHTATAQNYCCNDSDGCNGAKSMTAGTTMAVVAVVAAFNLY